MLRLTVPTDDPMTADLFNEHYHRIDLGTTTLHTPPVIRDNGDVIFSLGDGRVVRGNALSTNVNELEPLVTTAPGVLSLLKGDGLQLLGDCPSGRCLSIFYEDSASSFGAVFELMGEHRHSGLPADAVVSLPGPEGMAALVGGDRLDGLVVVAGSSQDAPWPGPDGGAGNGRCVESLE